MNRSKLIRTSKFLSLISWHDPGKANITLDPDGWADVRLICRQVNITPLELDEVVRDNDKKRFEYNNTKTMIRAKWGHSVNTSPSFVAQKPPDILYHGTATKFLDSIKKTGLVKGSRNHVHLSVDEQTASKVGERHGSPVVLIVDSAEMQKDGHSFYLASGNIWLTDNVPAKYIKFPAIFTPTDMNPLSLLEI